MFDLNTCVDLILYYPHNYFYVKNLFKHQSLKRERAEKALLWKRVWLGKSGDNVYKMYDAKAKGLFFKEI